MLCCLARDEAAALQAARVHGPSDRQYGRMKRLTVLAGVFFLKVRLISCVNRASVLRTARTRCATDG